jgi:hypothetical protein
MLRMNWMRGPMRAPEGEGTGTTPAAATIEGSTPSPTPSPTPPTESGVNNLLGNDPKNPARDPGEAKPPEAEKPAETAPKAFDAAALKPPEGVEKFDDGLLEKLGPVAEKHGLSTEAAQDLVNLHFDILKQAAQKWQYLELPLLRWPTGPAV